MALELLGHGPAGSVGAVRIIGAYFRQRLSVSAPAALEGEGIQVKDHYAAAQITIGGVKLVSGFVEANLFDILDDHRRGRGIFLPECRYSGRIGPSWRRSRKGSERARAALARIRIKSGSRFAATAPRGLLWRTRGCADELAGLRIVFVDGELADIDESFAIHGHAVALRFLGRKRPDDVALFVDVDHRWRARAAFGGGRIFGRVQLDVPQISGTIQHPDVVVLIHGEPGDASELPLIGE